MPDPIRTLKGFTFTPKERDVIRLAINTFGEFNHPSPTDENLPGFAVDYVQSCIEAALASPVVPGHDKLTCQIVQHMLKGTRP